MTDRISDQPTLPVVGIGASAGGLEAFKEFFGNMPADTGMAFVLIPHLDPDHKSLMAEIIGRHTVMPVLQVEKRMKIEPNSIYIVPPNQNLAIENEKIFPCDIPQKKGINMPVNYFFRSLAESKNEHAIGVILSGTMSDGTAGIKNIKEKGGLAIAQLPKTAQHDGMPRSAINTGMVDLVLPIKDMPAAIIKYISHPYLHGETRDGDNDDFDRVLTIIHARSNHDFKCYKRNTLIRRTERRMSLRQIENITDYVDLLHREPGEADALIKDFLIGVTGFFREEPVWEKLGNDILPMMIKEKDPDTQLRIWTPGCASGEETYTMAILVHDIFKRLNRYYNAQIFATDIDTEAIAVARSGIYPKSINAMMPSEYLKKYFVDVDKGYRIIKKIREAIVFAEQNLITDPPFSNLDIISCRNLLIYLKPDIQKKVIELFHFSLRQGGYLILGNSEAIGYHQELFDTVSKKLRIYRSIGSRNERSRIPVLSRTDRVQGLIAGTRPREPLKNMVQLMQSQLLKHFAPAVLINRRYEIVNLSGSLEKYLHMPQGDPAMELMAMVREGLRVKMRVALNNAVKKDEAIIVSNARVKYNNKFFPVRFTIIPVKEKCISEVLFLITFEEMPDPASDTKSIPDIFNGEEMIVHQLETELMNTREDLQNTIEELETSNEELKASNEEMMSMNEELQSSNEELETSKEELQSLNEELNTVNAELREKIEELERSNNDIVNLMNSTDVATIFLDINKNIRRFTPSAKRLFNLIPTDIGRPISDLSRRFNDIELADHTNRVLETLLPMDEEVENDTGHWFVRRILPFKTQDKRVDGLVLTFNDITEQKKAKQELEKIFSMSIDMICIADINKSTFLRVNPAFTEILGYSEDELLGRPFADFIHPEDIDSSVSVVEKNLRSGERVINFNNRYRCRDGSYRWLSWVSHPNPQKGVTYAVARDITLAKQIEEKLRRNEKKYKNLFNYATDGICLHEMIYNDEEPIDYRILDVNPKFEELTGIKKEEAIGAVASQLYQADTAPYLDTYAKVTGTGESISFDTYFKPMDKHFIISVFSPDQHQFATIFQDITERKKYETQIQQTQKMEAIGSLAGGIAHDFNNMLTVIIGNISLALLQASENEELYGILSAVMEGAKQARNLTQQLLTFAKGGEPIRKVVQLNRIIRESAEFVNRGSKSKCDFFLADDLWTVEVDPGQFNQVISNLVINANQAMPNGGTIRIRTENFEMCANNTISLPTGLYAKISIEDQGIGISEKHLPSIFDPYFSTKQKGSGLGLATTYSIIKRHGGHIAVYSEIEKGTVFTIYIPAILKSITKAEEKEAFGHQGQGRILIMDDQEAILKMAAKMFNRMGYETTVVTEGSKAVELFRDAYDSDDSFDLVVLDLTVPGGMGGAEVMPELQKIDPKVKALVSSGYSNDPIMANYQKYGFCGVAPKPYTKEQLSEVLNKIFQ